MFFVEGESVDMARFAALGVICESCRRSADEVREFIGELEGIFDNPGFTKEDIVKVLKDFLPNFEHEEKGKNLDQKM